MVLSDGLELQTAAAHSGYIQIDEPQRPAPHHRQRPSPRVVTAAVIGLGLLGLVALALLGVRTTSTSWWSDAPQLAQGLDNVESKAAVLPPWWILEGVKPAGPDKNMGSWKAVTFSGAQQKRFGIDKDGKVVDHKLFDAAIEELKKAKELKAEIKEAKGPKEAKDDKEAKEAKDDKEAKDSKKHKGKDCDKAHDKDHDEKHKDSKDSKGDAKPEKTKEDKEVDDSKESKEPKYNCFTKEVWPKEKQGWCCKYKKLGCPATKEPSEEEITQEGASYNCMTKEAWSPKKQRWCCEHKQLGCPEDKSKVVLPIEERIEEPMEEPIEEPIDEPIDEPMPIDEPEPLDEPKEPVRPVSFRASKEQQEKYGLDEQGKVVDQAKFKAALAASSPVLQPGVKKQPVLVGGNGGTKPAETQKETALNCYTREVWSPEKQRWCCKHKQLGCPKGQTKKEIAHNCLSRELWSPEKQRWCCEHKKLGCPQDHSKASRPGGTPPWWILKGVKPMGPLKDMGTHKAVTFSKEQQDLYGIDAAGTVVDKRKFDTAFARTGALPAPPAKKQPGRVGGKGGLPPWWISKGVKPMGPLKDMGGWKAVTFSKEQQERYGIDAEGAVMDKHKFNAAFANPAALEYPVKKKLGDNGALPPWWILKGVVPMGPSKDMGTHKAISFTKEQQELFGIDEDGTVVDRHKFASAPFPLASKKSFQSPAQVGGKGSLPPWWILKGVQPAGPAVGTGSSKAVSFSKGQQAHYGIDAQGKVTNPSKFALAFTGSSAVSKPGVCCKAPTAHCLACSKGQSVAEYCADSANAGVLGCSESLSRKQEPMACCEAMTAPCMACTNGETVPVFCAKAANADVPGCEQANRRLKAVSRL